MKDTENRKKYIEENKTQVLEVATRRRATGPRYCTRLYGNTDTVWRIVALPSEGLIVTASGDHAVRVYDMRRPKAAPQVLEMHTEDVYDVAALGGDVVVSVGCDGRVVTWAARVGKMLDYVQIDCGGIGAAAALSADCFVTGNCTGELVYYRHTVGSNLLKIAHCRWAHSKGIEVIGAYRNLMVAASVDKTASVWDVRTRVRLGVLHHGSPVWSVSISDDYIATCCVNQVRIFSTRRSFTLVQLFVARSYVNTLTFVGNDLLACGDGRGLVTFVRPSAASTAVTVRTPLNCVISICTAPDDQVVVSGDDGKCAVLCLANVRSIVQDFTTHFRTLQTTAAVKCGHVLRRRRHLALVTILAPLLLFFVKGRRQ